MNQWFSSTHWTLTEVEGVKRGRVHEERARAKGEVAEDEWHSILVFQGEIMATSTHNWI